jgi:sugar lactone lactonase YvrE
MTIGGIQDDTRYELVAADGSTAVFNDPTDPDYCGFAKFAGLEDAEVRETADDRTSADGGVHGPFWRGRRPVVANIEIAPASTIDRNTKYDKIMRAVGNSLRTDSTLTWTPDGSAEQFIRVRKQSRIARGEDSGWLTRLQIPMVAADPLKYSTVLRTDDSSPVTNAGNVETYPIIAAQWDGASPEITATKAATGEAVSFEGGLLYEYDSQFASGARPSGVAVDASGNIWVSRAQYGVVEKYNSSGTLLATVGSPGSGTTQFGQPAQVKIASDGNLLVVDYSLGRISKWNVSSNSHMSNFGDAQLTNPWGLAVDSSGNVFVGDDTFGGIRVFNSSGAHISDFTDTFQQIQSLEMRVGDVLIGANATDVYEYTNILGGGTFVGYVDTGFYNISDLAVDASSNLFVLDGGWEINGPSAGAYNTIWVYQFDVPGATADYTYASQFGQTGSGDGDLNGPISMGFGNARLYVADTVNNRVEAFGLGDITVDMYARSVYVGSNNAYSSIVGVPQWWPLDPGSNAFTVEGVTSFEIAWRDAWQ